MAFNPRESSGLNLREAVRFLNVAIPPSFECNKPDNLTRALYALKPAGVAVSYNPRLSNGANLRALVTALPKAPDASSEAAVTDNAVKAMFGLVPDGLIATYNHRESVGSNLARLIKILELQSIRANNSNIYNSIARGIWGLIDVLQQPVPEDVVIYLSNFSVDADGWFPVDALVVGNIDGIGGEDNCARLTEDGGRSSFSMRLSNILEVGKSYSFSLDYFVTAPTGITSLAIRASSTLATETPPTTDAWTTFNASGVATSTSMDIFIRYTGGSGWTIYFKNIKITEIA